MKNTEQQLRLLIQACQKKDRKSQKQLYHLFYSYAMTVGLHYSQNREEAKEIVNDSFVKVFQKLDKYDYGLSFKAWLRRIIINTAIDYHRMYHKHKPHLAIVHSNEPVTMESGFDKLAMDDLLQMIQALPPMYRLVFNLYIMEGFKHEEIAEQLGISVGTSKSNLSRAKLKLQQMLGKTKKKETKRRIISNL